MHGILKAESKNYEKLESVLRNVVTIATVFSKCLQNTHQKFLHNILGKVMKFQPLTQRRFRVMHKNHLGVGGGGG